MILFITIKSGLEAPCAINPFVKTAGKNRRELSLFGIKCFTACYDSLASSSLRNRRGWPLRGWLVNPVMLFLEEPYVFSTMRVVFSVARCMAQKLQNTALLGLSLPVR